jgi:hypothetical protein
MIIGFSGTRYGMKKPQRKTVNDILEHFHVPGTRIEFHTGMCVGADEEAARLANSWGYVTIGHPATLPLKFQTERKAPQLLYHEIKMPLRPLMRNLVIVEISEYMIFAPWNRYRPANLRGQGTWWTYVQAEEKHKPRVIVWPDGSFNEHDIEGM